MDKVERVARALCAADGREPDEQVEIGRTPLDFRGSEPVTSPLWQTENYQSEARRFVAASEALAGTITSDA